MSEAGSAPPALQIVFFTSQFPSGLGEEWKRSEVLALVREGWEVHIVPMSSGDGRGALLPDEVNVHPPVRSHRIRLRSALRTWACVLPSIARELPSALRSAPRLPRLRTFLRASIDNLRTVSAVSELPIGAARWRVLYFYWGRGAAEATGCLRRLLRPQRIVVRLHGYDLYPHRATHGYLPYRSEVWSADAICTVSEDGARWLTEHHPGLAGRVCVRRLGSPAMPSPAPPSTDGVLRAVSCSMLKPVKRVHQIPTVLAETRFQHVEWTHIGDGPERPSVEQALRRVGRVQGHLLGMLSPSKVRDRLARGPYDVFVNLSSSEGVPVSIMEALAAGLPVVATDVGGTSELVDESVGRLVDPRLDPSSVARAIEEVTDPQFRRGIAERARRRHADLCNETALAGTMVAEVFSPPPRGRTEPRDGPDDGGGSA